MAKFKDLNTRYVLISKSGEYTIARYDDLVLQDQGMGWVYFSRTVIHQKVKYILERYDHTKNSLFYRALSGADPLMKGN